MGCVVGGAAKPGSVFVGVVEAVAEDVLAVGAGGYSYAVDYDRAGIGAPLCPRQVVRFVLTGDRTGRLLPLPDRAAWQAFADALPPDRSVAGSVVGMHRGHLLVQVGPLFGRLPASAGARTSVLGSRVPVAVGRLDGATGLVELALAARADLVEMALRQELADSLAERERLSAEVVRLESPPNGGEYRAATLKEARARLHDAETATALARQAIDQYLGARARGAPAEPGRPTAGADAVAAADAADAADATGAGGADAGGGGAGGGGAGPGGGGPYAPEDYAAAAGLISMGLAEMFLLVGPPPTQARGWTPDGPGGLGGSSDDSPVGAGQGGAGRG
ncbi:hypothetical protein ACGFX4_11935 [Kitasatospora sp. NPDC048365]|uniref:hypothetical protein n=1 Tax=Kitasatospora sp. NPDC048365 TaxID=3364050 RepID=UPI003722463D